MTARVKGDSLHLEQGNNIIELKKNKDLIKKNVLQN